ncbi:uncharacterized protein LOC111872334 [Cryptotermes secundus]|uniref:uncharacterized protein LOC111872334 n=1 Tax=Cryptotermes secundus TaxID=105785 RepID=UPI000CD7AE5A|nr:uncharacterized protein LOC111872334 [Cryptotermes secundus]
MARRADVHGFLGLLLLYVLAVTLLASTGGVLSLKLVRVSVPQYKVRGDMALLECQYELGRNQLYSVKWYKDNEEFYRYVPGSDTIKQSYKVDGVRVEHQMSNDKQVALKSVNLKSSGTYRCEVSAERPNFSSAGGEGRMEVV